MRINYISKTSAVLPAPVQEDRLWSASDIHTQRIWWRSECRCNFQFCGVSTYIPSNICRYSLRSSSQLTARESFNKMSHLYNVSIAKCENVKWQPSWLLNVFVANNMVFIPLLPVMWTGPNLSDRYQDQDRAYETKTKTSVARPRPYFVGLTPLF